MANVLVTIPTGDRQIHTSVAQVVERLMRDPRGHRLSIRYPRHRPLENNLNHCVKMLLAEPFTHWLSMDADNPPKRNPLDLLALDVDIVGLPTPIWRCESYDTWPWYWNVYQRKPDTYGYQPWPKRSGLQPVDAIGTGCFLAHRRVFEHPDMQRGAFLRIWNADGTVEKGNDIAFCERARRAGFGIWAHFGYPCDHHCRIPLLELVRAVQGACEAETVHG